jgi:hypothetical protein
MARHAHRAVERSFSRFTPLLESGTGLRSRTGDNGIRVYKGVTIIKAGLGNQRDRNYYPVETLERAVRDGRFSGLKAYADHPDSVSEEIQPERTVRDMVGIYKNPRFVKEGREGRVTADLHLFRSAKWLSDTVDDLVTLGQADKIGLSINGRGKTVEKQLQLEEAADPLDVNWVEDFLVLRSADVVTEAGAGGGFTQLLESARGHGRTKETAMKLTEKQKKAIREAVNANDMAALGKLIKECGCTVEQAVAVAKETSAKGKKATEAVAAPAKKTAKKAAGAGAAEETDEAEDVDAVADTEIDADDAEAEDPDAELDAAHEEVVEGADDEDDIDGDDLEEDGDDEDVDGDDLEEDGDDEDLEESDEDEAPVRRGNGRHPLANAAEKIRSNTQAREAARTGGPLRMPAGKKTTIKGATRGSTAVNIIGTRRKQRGGQKGRKFGEAASGDLAAQMRRLREENTRLSNQLRIRQTADRARKLLKESAIPERLRPEVLRLMVGKHENEMQRIVRYHERVIGTAIEEAQYGDFTEGRVEGAGARIRESFHGDSGRGESDLGALLSESGIPTRGDE